MKNKIKYQIITILVAVLIIAEACKDELEKTPLGVLDPATAVSTPENVEKLIIGVYGMVNGYNPTTGSAWQTSVTNWVYGDVTSDDAYKGSETTDQAPALLIEKFTHDASNSYFNAKWRALYEGVKRANDAIRALTENGGSAEKIAEVRFLRGHFYFDLKKNFDNVPYIDENSESFFKKNHSGEELTWEHIEADFNAGVKDLPTSQAHSGRPTKYSAQAYLGKAFMFQQKYAEAKAAFDAVVSSGKYNLLADYQDVYDPSKKSENKETLFVVHHSIKDGAGSDANGDYGSSLSGIQGGPGGCCGFYVPTQDLVNAHQTVNGLPILPTTDGVAAHNANPVKSDFGIKTDEAFTPHTGELDPRLDFNVGRRGIEFKGWGVHPGMKWARDPLAQGHYSQKKRFLSKEQTGSYQGTGGWGELTTAIDYHVIRYADVLLMLAEAEVEVGSLNTAMNLVNQVRERAKNSTYIKDSDGKDAANYKIEIYNSFPSKDYARRAVRFERRLELSLEGHRFYDLVRWGLAKTRIDDYKSFESNFNPNGSGYISYIKDIDFTAGKNERFPIPQSQIDLSVVDGETVLKQNSGY